MDQVHDRQVKHVATYLEAVVDGRNLSNPMNNFRILQREDIEEIVHIRVFKENPVHTKKVSSEELHMLSVGGHVVDPVGIELFAQAIRELKVFKDKAKSFR
jgi:hypothetical protein